MIEVAEGDQTPKRALLIGFQFPEETWETVNDQLSELAELVANLQMVPLEPEIVRIRSEHTQYLIGTGKAAEIAQQAQECEADLLVFDSDLSPSQQRNWERLAKCPVVDRQEIILDIFFERAHTKEAVLQVELARAKYQLPRVTRAWTHFSRQRGGGATNRGEGEAQIETDRRLLRRKIRQLEEELTAIKRQRQVQRRSRQRRPVISGAIVGYTNVGKSSLLKSLSGADILVKNQLFATLDPTARKVKLDKHLEIVLTDTVGFVRKLPHQLVEAFKSTLEEAVLADLLLLVLDISSPRLEVEWETTLGVLKELGADEKQLIVVFNKMDLIDPERDKVLLARLHGLFPNALYISTLTGYGITELKQKLTVFASGARQLLQVVLPPERFDLVALAHRNGEVYEEEYESNGFLKMIIALEKKYHHHFSEFQQ